jgi:hypothetical protein
LFHPKNLENKFLDSKKQYIKYQEKLNATNNIKKIVKEEK